MRPIAPGIELPLRQFLCPCDGPVGDDDDTIDPVPGAVRPTRPAPISIAVCWDRSERSGVPGLTAANATRNRAIADRGIRAHPLGGGEGVLKEPSEASCRSARRHFRRLTPLF